MSDYASVNGIRIMSGRLVLPRYGAWVADFVLATPDDLAGSVTVSLGDLSLVGAVYRTAPFAGSRHVRLVAGAGGWRQTLASRAYQNPAGILLSLVLGDAAREVGETVAVGTDRSLGTDWVREREPASRLLRLLTGGTWWIDTAGVTQLSARSTTPITSAFQVIDYQGGAGKYQIATEVLSDWTPGRTFSAPTLPAAATIGLVAIIVDNDGKLRLDVLSGSPEQDRLIANVLEVVRSEFPSATYQGLYLYAVQATDGVTVDAAPLDTTLGLPAIVKATLWPSTTGEQVTPATSSRCVVAFLNGNPALPVVMGGDPTKPPTLTKLAGGGPGVARAGDPVQITQAQVVSAALVANLVTGAVTAANAIAGSILTGSSKVQSG